MANFDGTPLVGALTNDPLSPDIKTQQAHYYRVDEVADGGVRAHPVRTLDEVHHRGMCGRMRIS